MTCGSRWYVVGAVIAADGVSRPAAWSSTDGRRWQSIPVAPHTYYGRLNVLYTAACRGDVLAAVGGRPGGAHGNPRVSSWYTRDDGTLEEVLAGFELFGGPTAVNVGRLGAGPKGWLIVGNRTSGAAVWTSQHPTEFRILEGRPELANDSRGEPWAFDLTPTTDGWLVVGGIVRTGRIDRDPMAWTSTDGSTWRRTSAPATDEYEELQRVTVAGGVPVAVGLRGSTFGAWRDDRGTWRPVARFGSTQGGRGVAAVRSLRVAGRDLLAVTSDGSAHTLWISDLAGRSWQRVNTPVPMPSSVDRSATLTGTDRQLLLLTDDGRTGRGWLADARTGR